MLPQPLRDQHSLSAAVDGAVEIAQKQRWRPNWWISIMPKAI
jgi:hypothetical protein